MQTKRRCMSSGPMKCRTTTSTSYLTSYLIGRAMQCCQPQHLLQPFIPFNNFYFFFSLVEEVLDNTDLQVVVFNGQLDLIVDSLGTLRWVDRLEWSGSSQWRSANREPLTINGVIEGYVKNAKNLYFYWINRAGHMVSPYYTAKFKTMLRRAIFYIIY